jgi:hypothetical protein
MRGFQADRGVHAEAGTTRMDYEIFYNQYQVFALLMAAKLRIFQRRLSAEWTP